MSKQAISWYIRLWNLVKKNVKLILVNMLNLAEIGASAGDFIPPEVIKL